MNSNSAMEPKTYKAKLIDQISEKSKRFLERHKNCTGTFIITADNRLSFFEDQLSHYKDESWRDHGGFTTSELQSDPVHQGNEMIFVTKNSTYVFEMLEEYQEKIIS